MRWRYVSTIVLILSAFAILAIWQWDEYGHECDLAKETVDGSSESIMNALVGGVCSHRRLGQFFAEQAESVLEGLAQSKDVRAVAMISEDRKEVISAGNLRLLDLQQLPPGGQEWTASGLLSVKTVRLPTESSGPAGYGRGGGRGRRWADDEKPPHFLPGSRITAVLLVDRERTDLACRRAAVARLSIVAAGWLVVLCVAWAWLTALRLVDARGRQRTLEAESRHYRELSQAAAGLAHETRNPLGLIRGWTQRLAETAIESAEARRQAEAVVEECDRVTARINQFLAFARPSEPKFERFDPAELLQELAALVEPDLSAKRLSLALTAAGQVIAADRELFRQAIFNLLQNAIHASPEDAVIDVALVRSGSDRMRVEIADRGPGVAEADRDKLFTPYFTTRGGGTGLGLAMVRRIAAAHRWRAGYSPRPGGGSVFWLDDLHG